MKTKGYTTLEKVWDSNYNRFSYTINFGKYINKDNNYDSKQNLLGLRKISFNNMLWDPSYLKEYLSYYLFNEMNVISPNYNLANLYINNDYKGLYFMIEGIDSSLIKRSINDNSDFTFKVEEPGGSLVYDKELDNYINKDGIYDFSSLIYDKDGNIIYPKGNVLAKYNGIWENDEDNFKDIIDYLPTFFSSLKELNELSNMKNKDNKDYENRIEKIIDIDSLARYFAINNYLVDSDGYIGSFGVNYVLHMSKDGYFTIIPWDYNLAFGGIFIRDIKDVINFDINGPMIGVNLKDRPLYNIILKNKNYNKLYRKYLKDVLIITTDGGITSDNKEYDKDNFKKIIEDKKDYIIKQQKKDKESMYNSDDISRANDSLVKLIELRSKVVNNRLNNNYKLIDSNGITLKDIGSIYYSGNLKKD